MKKQIKKSIATFLLIFIVVLVFTFIDFLFHIISKEYSVPSWYFRNKIIVETIYVVIAYYALRRLNPALSSFIAAVVTSALLQARYYVLGFDLEFVHASPPAVRR